MFFRLLQKYIFVKARTVGEMSCTYDNARCVALLDGKLRGSTLVEIESRSFIFEALVHMRVNVHLK